MAADPGDVERLAAACRARLGDPASWVEPRGYPDSLALCVLDAVWSVGINYLQHVVPVLNAYVRHRGLTDLWVCQDGAPELAAILGSTGAEGFADLVRSRHRTSTTNGILKSEAVERAIHGLLDGGLRTAADVRTASAPRLDKVRGEWVKVPGQRTGITWRYMLMLTGLEEVKPDRMIVRFVTASLARQRPVEVEAAYFYVVAAASALGVSQRVLDHTIWNYQRQRRPGRE